MLFRPALSASGTEEVVVSNFVNLNETGALTHAGKQYGANAEDQNSESTNFRGRMEAANHGLKGAAGGTFGTVADLSATNLTQLANQIAEQAVRAVRAEGGLVHSDEDADGLQHGTLANVESHSSAVARPINA
jgi:hypothetical protein